MRVMIVSDTHGRHAGLDLALEEAGKIDMFIHLGDVEGGEAYIDAVVECEKHIVRGNNDFFCDLPKEEEFYIGPYRAFISHGHTYCVSLDPEMIREEGEARGADIVSVAVMERMKEPDCPRPLISSSCPAVVRLIQTRFPELIDNIVDVRSPMEVAASQARSEFAREKGVDPKDVGCFFITPCAAKMTAIRKPLGHEKSAVDGAISFLEVYGLLSGQIKKAVKPEDAPSPRATSFGIGWARTGGEAGAVQQEESLAVDGIDNVIRVLEEIEDNRLPGLRFFEGMACFGGCIGGPLSFENPFIARNRIRKLVLSLPKVRPQDVVSPEEISGMADEIFCDKPLEPVKVMQLGKDVREALHNMERVEELSKKLPGLDCGSCGSPSCQALAEDIVLGYATEMDCLVLLKERLRQMAHQMVEMSETTRK